MKRIYLLIIVAIIGIFAISCKKEESPEPTDPRDQWVGSYTSESNGSLTFTISGQSFTQPLNTSSNFDIKKGNSSTQIIFVDEDGGSTTGTINGNSVTFEPMTETTSSDGVDFQIIGNTTGTISGNVFNYKMTITGTGYYSGVSFPISGLVTSVAYKQ